MQKTFLPIRDDVKEILAHRPPTSREIEYGHGAVHYRLFPVEVWKHRDGRPKKWIKAVDDGLRYYR